MYGIISYLIFSETASLLDTWAGTIALIVAFTVCILVFGVLLCVLVRRQNKQARKLEHTSVIPSARAMKTRQRYLP